MSKYQLLLLCNFADVAKTDQKRCQITIFCEIPPNRFLCAPHFYVFIFVFKGKRVRRKRLGPALCTSLFVEVFSLLCSKIMSNIASNMGIERSFSPFVSFLLLLSLLFSLLRRNRAFTCILPDSLAIMWCSTRRCGGARSTEQKEKPRPWPQLF